MPHDTDSANPDNPPINIRGNSFWGTNNIAGSLYETIRSNVHINEPVFFDYNSYNIPRHIGWDSVVTSSITPIAPIPPPEPAMPDLSNMSNYEKHCHFKSLYANNEWCKKGFICIGYGNEEHPLSEFWEKKDIYSESGRNNNYGRNPSIRFYVLKHVWYDKFYSDIFTHSDKCIIGRITTKFKNGLLNLSDSLLELKNRIGKDFVVLHDVANTFILPEFANYDRQANKYYKHFDGFLEVTTSLNHDGSTKKEYWHKNTVTPLLFCFYCYHTSRYYAKNYFTRVLVEGDAVCFEMSRSSIFTWQDGSMHWTKEFDTVPDYHSITRKWDEEEINQQIGVELEIYSPNRGLLNKELPKEDIFGETDGSLCRHNGIELIGKPYNYSDYISGKTKWNNVFETAIKYGSVGFNTPDQNHNYGMHVSMSRNMFNSKMHLAKFVIFFNMQEELCKLVAQRDIIYQGNYKIRKKIVNSKYSQDRIFPVLFVNDNRPAQDSRRLYIETGKYEAVSVLEKRVECRIFNSTLSWERFLKNIEFCVAVRNYTLNASNVIVEDETKGTNDFIHWLFKQPDFSNLKRFFIENSGKKEKVDMVLKTIKYRLSPSKNKKVIDNL